MARRAATDLWVLKKVEVDAFRKLRDLLTLNDGDVARAIDMDRSTFSHAQRGQNGKGFSAQKTETLRLFLKEKVDKLSADARAERADGATARAALSCFDQFFAKEEGVGSRYVSPGGALPADASSYLVRACDSQLESVVNSSANAVAVVGGPRTGKSSLLLRLAEVASEKGRPVRSVNVGEAWARAKRADGKLSLVELANLVAFAITNDPKPLLKAGTDPKFLINVMQERFIELMSKPGLGEQILILDGFNEIVDYVEDQSDAAAILGCLFSHTLRRDRMMIVVPDDGLCAASERVSEVVSRSWQLFARQIMIYDVETLTLQILGAESQIDRAVILDMMEAFGGFLFLHHVALDRVRSANAQSATDRNTLLSKAVADIISTLGQPQDPSRIGDQIQRELARFGARVATRLRQIQQAQTVNNPHDRLTYALGRSEDPESLISQHYIVRRQLSWTGFMPEGEAPPRFIRAIAASMEPPR